LSSKITPEKKFSKEGETRKQTIVDKRVCITSYDPQGDGLNQVEIVFTHSKSMDQNGSKHAHKGLEVQYSLHSTVEVKRTYGKCIIYPHSYPSIHASITAQQYAFLIL
jgi:hypothetical protein